MEVARVCAASNVIRGSINGIQIFLFVYSCRIFFYHLYKYVYNCTYITWIILCELFRFFFVYVGLSC